MKYAALDKEPTLAKQGGGYYMCYCKKFSDSFDAADPDDFCYNYQFDKYWGLSLTSAVSFLVSAVNIMLRYLVQFLIDMVGYDTDSERLSVIMVVSFLSAFVNTAIIPLLTNANF